MHDLKIKINRGTLENALKFCSFLDGARLFRELVWEIRTVPHWCDSGRNSGWKTRREAEDDSSADRPKYGKKLSLLAKRNSSLKSFQKGSKDIRWVRSNLAGYRQGRLNISFCDHEQDKILGSICPNQYGGPYNSHRSEIWGPRVCDQNWLSWGCVEYMGWPRYFPANQVTQLAKMLDSLLEGEIEEPDLLECYFLEALYCSLGSCLLEDGRAKFDECIKRIASLPTADTEGIWASPGELPGRN